MTFSNDRPRLLRTLRWLAWAMNVSAYFAVVAYAFEIHDHLRLRIAWIAAFVFSTMNLVLFIAEDRTKGRGSKIA